jgi:hypothetical protein
MAHILAVLRVPQLYMGVLHVGRIFAEPGFPQIAFAFVQRSVSHDRNQDIHILPITNVRIPYSAWIYDNL